MIRKSPTLDSSPGWLTTIAYALFTGSLFVVVHIVLDQIYRDVPGLLVFAALAALLAGLGAVFFWLARGERQQADAYDRRMVEHPNEPWLWPSDWASGRITYSGTRDAISYWKFTAFYAFAAGFILVIFRLVGKHMALSGAFRAIPFALVGVGVVILIGTIVATRRGLRFGTSTFELATLPGAVGGRVSGQILSTLRPADLAPMAGSDDGCLRLRLTCTRYVYHRGTASTGQSGSNSSPSSVSENILWQDQQVLTSVPPDRAGGSIVPVSFDLPSDVPPTSGVDRGETWVTWTLKAEARLEGPDYYAEFEVPVFAVAQAARASVAGEAVPPGARSQPVASRDMRARLRERGIDVISSDGQTRFHFARGRSNGMAALTALFGAVFGLVTALLARQAGGGLIVTGIIAVNAVLGLAAGWFWLGVTDMVASPNGVAVRKSMLGIGLTRRLPAAAIKQLQAGFYTPGQSAPYFAVWVLRRDGKKTAAGGMITKADAEWLAGEMNCALGKKQGEPAEVGVRQ